MNINEQINSVIAYLDGQSIFLSSLEFGKNGNGTAQLTFMFNKNNHKTDEIKQILAQYAQKSVKMIQCSFSNSSDDANISIATIDCTYDFTQELNTDEVEKLSAAKGIDGYKVYKHTDIDIESDNQGIARGKWSREVRVDDHGNYFGTPYWTTGSGLAKRNALGKYVKISKEQADSDSIDYFPNRAAKTISC